MSHRPRSSKISLLGLCAVLAWSSGCHLREREALQDALVQCQARLSKRPTRRLVLAKAPKPRVPKRARALPRPLPASAYGSLPALAGAWSARSLTIHRLPRTPHRGKKPAKERRLRYIRNMFWRMMRYRRKRIAKGLPAKDCRRAREALRRYPSDPQSRIQVLACGVQHHFRGQIYIQVGFEGALIFHRKRWDDPQVRAFLSRYRVLIEQARVLGFFRFLFVGTDDYKRRHYRFDFKNKWYGREVRFQTLPRRAQGHRP